ncbi:prenyltransferase/squalene oxidase repeat-containing protein [Thermococcus henrietii]|uniref:prenyltransferase/squalene oxidase repeat-containing protein n=1 Tax=Thermococcus henrietii TaxID=2016361 RepID=UPI000C072D87|nr:prenyltransferase/squalene oxidase repeat-containing protein [Thermococcus henrietii]
MRKMTVVLMIFLILLALTPPEVAAREVPYVYDPTIPTTALAAVALYKAHEYQYVLEADVWLMKLRTPQGAWAYQYGMAPQAKYTALALMALMRGESIARGLFNKTIHAGVYWLLYKQRKDGSFGDYTDTALAVVALREYEDFAYSWLPVKKAITNGIYYLQTHTPGTTMGQIFGYMALGDVKDLRKVEASGVNALYKAFAIAYLTGENVQISSPLRDPASLALLLYATGEKRYAKELLNSLHFGFWGVLKYQPPDLLEAATLPGFYDLKPIACPYMLKVQPRFEWEKVVLARYYVECNHSIDLSEIHLQKLKPWMVAEIARLNHDLGKPYEREISYLLDSEEGNHWGNFYDTAYIVWVLSALNITMNYTPVLNWLASNVRDDYPNYYYAYALVDFDRFGMKKALNRTLTILKRHQHPSGGWGYNAESPDNIKTTAEVLRALLETGLSNTETYRKGYEFIRRSLYADIPQPTSTGSVVELKNATFLLIKNGIFYGNTTERMCVNGLEGYVVVYPSTHPLTVSAVPVTGFRAENPWKKPLTEMWHQKEDNRLYIVYCVAVVLFAGAFGYAALMKRKGKRSR